MFLNARVVRVVSVNFASWILMHLKARLLHDHNMLNDNSSIMTLNLIFISSLDLLCPTLMPTKFSRYTVFAECGHFLVIPAL